VVGVGVATERSCQVRAADVWVDGVECDVLVGAGQESKCFLVGMTFGRELLQDGVGIARRTGPGHRKGQQLPQPDVGGVPLKRVREHVVGKERCAIFQVAFTLVAARVGGWIGSGQRSRLDRLAS